MIRRWLRSIAHPIYDCEDCIGMGQHGCFCSYNGASAPGVGPSKMQRLAFWLLGEK